MSNDVAVLQQRLASAEAAAARLSNQVTVGAEQNKALRTTVVGLEASVERKAREIQALAALVDVDDPIGNAMAPPPSAQRTAQQLYPDIFDDDKPSAAQQAIQGASQAKSNPGGLLLRDLFRRVEGLEKQVRQKDDKILRLRQHLKLSSYKEAEAVGEEYLLEIKRLRAIIASFPAQVELAVRRSTSGGGGGGGEGGGGGGGGGGWRGAECRRDLQQQ